MSERYSIAEDAAVETNPARIATREAENAVRQFDATISELELWLGSETYLLRSSAILKLQRLAVEGIDKSPGTFRSGGVAIHGSRHKTPDAEDVPELVEEFCDYINSNWRTATSIHLAAYALWRLNWIHPFRDGNGRTARAISYLILNAHAGYRLPGNYTIPDQIVDNKAPYYNALEAADNSASEKVDVSEMEVLLSELLGIQLVKVYEKAAGHAVAIPQEEVDNDSANGKKKNLLERNPVLFGLIGVLATAAVTFFGYFR